MRLLDSLIHLLDRHSQNTSKFEQAEILLEAKNSKVPDVMVAPKNISFYAEKIIRTKARDINQTVINDQTQDQSLESIL